ncbi:Hypothetical predicted protein [Marmota monax]|uniref:Uncharacterized protein n=1 Tax=Marmota monax TaxID=9995 RepID=A0A5E4D5F3_MARMO|nr:Hypothetical predicted protein [Marmota monax]
MPAGPVTQKPPSQGRVEALIRAEFPPQISRAPAFPQSPRPSRPIPSPPGAGSHREPAFSAAGLAERAVRVASAVWRRKCGLIIDPRLLSSNALSDSAGARRGRGGGRLPSSRRRAPSRSYPSPRLSPIPHAGPRFPCRLGLPSRPPPAPPPHPRPDVAPRVIFIRNIPKSVPLAQAEPGAALALISWPRLLPSERAGGGGCGGGVGGWGGWEGVQAAPVRPGRAVPEQQGDHAVCGGVQALGSPARPPSRLMLRVGAHPARGDPAGQRSRAGGWSPSLRSRRSSEVKVSRGSTGRSER